MDNTLRHTPYPGSTVSALDFPYPLQQKAILWGLAVTVISGLVVSPLAGFSFGVLIWAAGILWRNGEPPILVFCLFYQWSVVVWGYLYYQVTDTYPGFPILGDIDQAVLLSLTGLVAITVGLRAGFQIARGAFEAVELKFQTSQHYYDIPQLFWWVIALHTVTWFVEIQPMKIMFDIAQVIYRLLELRTVLLFLLLLSVLQQRHGYSYGALALLCAIVPTLASMMSNFKEYLFVLLVALLSQWRPWSHIRLERERSLRIAQASMILAATLIVLGVVWEARIKPVWRPAIVSGEVGGAPLEKIKAFLSINREAVSGVQPGDSFAALVSNLSSTTGYFSHVLLRVPDYIPYEHGQLLLRALEHVFKPRILFPEKQNLGSDSWLIRKYAGLLAAGEESGTSIGLGYIAEFYIDFGSFGMFLGLFAYGIVLALACQSLIFFSPSHNFYCSAVAILFLQHFLTLGEIAKQLGGFVQSVLVFAVFLRFLAPYLHGKLLQDRSSAVIPAEQESS